MCVGLPAKVKKVKDGQGEMPPSLWQEEGRLLG